MIKLFTAQNVKELRDLTGCGMMDCKKALTEAEGNMEKAIELLREKGLATAAKKAGRIAAEGIVDAYVHEGQIGVLLEVNSETDFVAKNNDFREFVKNVALQIAINNPNNVEELLAQTFVNEQDKTIDSMLKDKIATIGENINIRRFSRYDGVVETYIHGGGRIGVLVEFGLDNMELKDSPKFKEFAKDIAMQVAASIPLYLNRDEIPEDVLEKEKEIFKAQALNEGKPVAIVDKMIIGRVSKFYKDVCLLEQPFVKDPDISVTKYIENKSNELGAQITVNKFVRFEKGEGIQKKEENFADEIANMIK